MNAELDEIARDPFEPDEWISAAEALSLARASYPTPTWNETFAKRAHAGLLRAWAEVLLVGDRAFECADIPAAFWWADGHAALTQNWFTGDFETWVGKHGYNKAQWKAFGVHFHRGDLEGCFPLPSSLSSVKLNPGPQAALDQTHGPNGWRSSPPLSTFKGCPMEQQELNRSYKQSRMAWQSVALRGRLDPRSSPL